MRLGFRAEGLGLAGGDLGVGMCGSPSLPTQTRLRGIQGVHGDPLWSLEVLTLRLRVFRVWGLCLNPKPYNRETLTP